MSRYLMHLQSGDVEAAEEWRADYESMDLESWFGKHISEITPEDKANWEACGHLIEVVKNEDGDWVEA